jgi:hypothetical protein
MTKRQNKKTGKVFEDSTTERQTDPFAEGHYLVGSARRRLHAYKPRLPSIRLGLAFFREFWEEQRQRERQKNAPIDLGPVSQRTLMNIELRSELAGVFNYLRTLNLFAPEELLVDWADPAERWASAEKLVDDLLTYQREEDPTLGLNGVLCSLLVAVADQLGRLDELHKEPLIDLLSTSRGGWNNAQTIYRKVLIFDRLGAKPENCTGVRDYLNSLQMPYEPANFYFDLQEKNRTMAGGFVLPALHTLGFEPINKEAIQTELEEKFSPLVEHFEDYSHEDRFRLTVSSTSHAYVLRDITKYPKLKELLWRINEDETFPEEYFTGKEWKTTKPDSFAKALAKVGKAAFHITYRLAPNSLLSPANGRAEPQHYTLRLTNVAPFPYTLKLERLTITKEPADEHWTVEGFPQKTTVHLRPQEQKDLSFTVQKTNQRPPGKKQEHGAQEEEEHLELMLSHQAVVYGLLNGYEKDWCTGEVFFEVPIRETNNNDTTIENVEKENGQQEEEKVK